MYFYLFDFIVIFISPPLLRLLPLPKGRLVGGQLTAADSLAKADSLFSDFKPFHNYGICNQIAGE